MKQRAFGTTGLHVSVLGLGAGQVGDANMPEQNAERLLNEALDNGITLIDTARGYGLSEERIGRYISHRRSEFVLSTKVGYSVEGYEDWTYDCIVHGIDAALQRMKTDYIDIVHLHSCGLDTLQRGDVIIALEDAKQSGKVRVIAYSGDNEALGYAIQSGRFDSIETSINICDQRVIHTGLAMARDRGLGVIAKRPIANGPWRFEERPVGHYGESYWERFRTMNLDSAGLGWDELALRFTASLRGVHSFIVGTTRVEHLHKNIGFVEKGDLPGDVMKSIQDSFQRHGDQWTGLT